MSNNGECEGCGVTAHCCNYCEARACDCDGGQSCSESEIATCGECFSKDAKSWGDYLWFRKLTHDGLKVWVDFPRPQVSFPYEVES